MNVFLEIHGYPGCNHISFFSSLSRCLEHLYEIIEDHSMIRHHSQFSAKIQSILSKITTSGIKLTKSKMDFKTQADSDCYRKVLMKFF